MTFKKKIFLVLYYAVARHLPESSKSRLSKYLRYVVCKNIFLKCGKNVNIERGAWFGNGCNIVIGENSGIGKNCHIQNNTIIGENVMMGPNCYILESKHLFDDTKIPMINQGTSSRKCQVVIKDDVWIGRDVMIIGDKTIETGTIIGARTVLTKNFPAFSIVGGNPSILIRSRLK